MAYDPEVPMITGGEPSCPQIFRAPSRRAQLRSTMAGVDLDDAGLRETAARQAGMLSAVQLLAAGVGRDQIRSRVRSGRWQQPQRGVYATFSGPIDRAGRIWAALLRCGDGATVSHQTAAELQGLADDRDAHRNGEHLDDRPVHVTIPATRRVRGRTPGIVVHYAHRLDQTRHPALDPPQTRPEATVLDLVDTSWSARWAAGWILRTCQRRRSTPQRLAAHLAERKKIKWRPMAESMLAEVAHGAQSMLEVQHLRAVERAHRLPDGDRQRRVAGNRVIWIDVDYSLYGVRVELDGRVGHDGDGAFRDRRRDNRAVVDGKVTLRYGHAEVFGTPCAVAAEQGRVLRACGWTGRPVACGPDCPLR